MATPVDQARAVQLQAAIDKHLIGEADERARCLEHRETAACVRAKKEIERAVAAYSGLVQLYGGKKLSPGEKCTPQETVKVGPNDSFCVPLSEDNPPSRERLLLDSIGINLRVRHLLYFYAPTSLRK